MPPSTLFIRQKLGWCETMCRTSHIQHRSHSKKEAARILVVGVVNLQGKENHISSSQETCTISSASPKNPKYLLRTVLTREGTQFTEPQQKMI